jgi:hypothetical protein
MADGGDIIIKGGSCDLIFDDSIYPPDPGDPKKHINKNHQKVIRVQITGDITFDSGDHPNGLTCTITTSVK